MKKLLLEVFEDLKKEYPDFRVIGKEVMFSLDNGRYSNDNRYVKIAFTIHATTKTPCTDVFNGCRIDIMSRDLGKLDSQIIAFEDAFENIIDLNHPNGMRKYIANYGGYDWYEKPTEKDLQDLREEVKGYLTLIKK